VGHINTDTEPVHEIGTAVGIGDDDVDDLGSALSRGEQDDRHMSVQLVVLPAFVFA
jgi:hypothetical protein